MKIIKNIANNEKKINRSLENFIKRTGPITNRQLSNIFGYKIKIKSKNIIESFIKKWENTRFNIDFKGFNVFSYKGHSGQKIIHNLLLIETYTLIKNDIGGSVYNTFFDGEISIALNTISAFEYGNIYLKPDLIVIRGNSLYCIEMDMGTESYNVLKEKELAYRKLIKNYPHLNIVIYFSSYKKRNDKLIEYGYFKGLNITYINIDQRIRFKNKKLDILI